MSTHDSLCPWDTEDFRGNSRRCECRLIAAAAEREKHRADLVISFWAIENENLRKRIAELEADRVV